MVDLLARLKQAQEDIDSLGFQCALVGGFAVGLQVRPRMTKDVDFVVAVEEDAQAEALMRGLHKLGYGVVQLLEHEEAKRLSALRLRFPNSESASAEVDLLFASSGIEAEVVEQAVEMPLAGGGTVRVASIGHLIAMKHLSVRDERPNDRNDLRSLIVTASRADLDQARTAVQLIRERGFDRDRDLEAELDQLISSRDR